MIEFSTIEAIIMTYAPLLVTIIGIIISFVKMIGAVRSVKKENKDQFEELKAQYQAVLQDNANLRKNINELLTKIDHINRGVNSDKQL